jgi:hypothetical protein
MGLCFLSGCYHLVPDSHFVFLQKIDESVMVEYKAYVTADKSLTQFSKGNRLETVATFEAVLEEYGHGPELRPDDKQK